jgi:hypothetical protein
MFAAILILLIGCGAAQAGESTPVFTFGEASAPLNGPWKFRLGDDAHWADPAFDDSAWETIDLTPLPGAHDDDVGLSNYVPGWGAHGHPGYSGFAWYRLQVRVTDPGNTPLWLAGPAMVDNIYQLFVNGQLLGGIGDFAPGGLTVRAIHPQLFALPRSLWTLQDGQLQALVAVRVALVKGAADPRQGGGMHIAPLLGTEQAVGSLYQLQWLQKVEGYLLDAAEPLVFLALAIMAATLWRFAPGDGFYPWIIAVLILLGFERLNQPLYWLGGRETLRTFFIWRLCVADALLLGSWILSWRAAFGLQRLQWLAYACALLGVLYLPARGFGTSILLPGLSAGVQAFMGEMLKLTRYGFLSLLVVVVVLGLSRRRVHWSALAAIVCGSATVFARELSQLHVPGIWFPFGVGVSLSECANLAFAAMLFIYLLHRLWRFLPQGVAAPAAGDLRLGPLRRG